MKKIFSLFFVFVGVLTTGIFAQNQVLTVGNNGNNMNQTVLMLSNETQTTIRFDLNAVELFEIETGYGNAFILTSDNAPLMLEEGSPELFYLTTSFIIPDQGGSELEISYGSYQDFENIDIAPSKGSLSRNIDPNTVPYVKGDVYQRDGFFPGTLENLREPFIMRDVRGQSIDVYPVQYNPVTKTLRVYSEITVTVNKTKETGINEFTTQKRNKTIDPTFNDMYSRLFINSSTLNSRGYPTGEEGELLIICHSDWVNDMQPYINWKRTIGRKTTIVPTSAISPLTAANIKTYIQNFYNNPDNNLAFVLFVGDYQQLPPHQVGSTRSDVEYCKLAGSDDYLEILTGRMSCETPAHVQTQVQRAIEYERDLITDDTWITSAIGVADVQGSGIGHDGGEADYVHLNNIRTRLLNYGYTTVYQEYSGVGSGTTNAQISADFNAGVSMGNYCNHGSPTCWTLNSGPNYCSSDVNALQNARKLPYIFSVACNNGEFGPWQYNSSNAVCFAEAWLRASQSGQPTGAIAFFGATISISWQEPQTAQDEFVNICLDLPSPYSGTQPGIKRTIAGAMLNASQKMIMVHNNSDAKACFNSWIVFGDPTLNFRTKTPQEMAISHQSALLIGMNSLSVTCDAEGAVAALTCIENDEVVILGTATVTNGTAEINFDSSTLAPMDLILTVTGFNKVTYMSEISLIPPSGPYVVPGGYTVVGDEVLTYISENKEISITLKNVGVAATTPLSVTISCDDSQLTITSNTATCGSIAPDGTATVNFNVTVANDIIDGKIFPVNVTVTETSKTSWDGKLMLKAFAPSFELEKVLINGAANGSLPKGTIVTLTTVIKNKGGADAFNLKGSLEMNSPYVILACDEDKSRAAINLVAGESTSFDFVVITSPDMPFGHIANFDLLVNANYGITHEETFTVSNSGSNNYCIPGSSNCSSYNDRITSIQILKTSDQEVLLNDPTPSCTAGSGYTDYTNVLLEFMPGEQYTIKVKTGYQNHKVKGWIDLNGNNAFDSNEAMFVVTCTSANTEYSANFTIPQDFAPGSQRFRIRTRDSGTEPDACGSYSWGQTLDYTAVLPELYARVQNVEAVLTGTTITTTWEAPAEGTPIGYNVYRNGDTLNVSLLTNLTFTEEDVTEGVYVYNVTAVYEGNKESFSEMSNVICYTASIIEPELCEKPVELAGIDEETNAILTWNTPENIDGELLGYNIYRDEVKINTEILEVTGYTDEDLENGTYIYKVSAIYEHCEESELTEGVSVTINVLGIHNLPSSSFSLFPNPTTGELRVMSYGLQVARIEIFDVYGRSVMTKFPSNTLEGWQPKADGVVLNVSHLQDGIYFVKIYSKTGDVAVKRLVIMK